MNSHETLLRLAILLLAALAALLIVSQAAG
jgi:hypothetical protein